jgi:hypothetical protein
MEINPKKIHYMKHASGRIGAIKTSNIEQCVENLIIAAQIEYIGSQTIRILGKLEVFFPEKLFCHKIHFILSEKNSMRNEIGYIK